MMRRPFLCGRGVAIGSVESDVATSLPYVFVTVTDTRSVKPMSALVGLDGIFALRGIVLQFSPVASHRCHTNSLVRGSSPSYEPVDAVSCRPIASVPTIAGELTARGAKCAL